MPVLKDLFSYSQASDLAFVTCRHSLLAAPWTDVEKAVDRLVESVRNSQPRALLLDLSWLPEAPSPIMVAMLRLNRAVLENAGRMAIVATSGQINATVGQAGLTDHLTISPDPATALRNLGFSSNVRMTGSEVSALRWVPTTAVAAAAISLLIAHIPIEHLVQGSQILFSW